MEEDFAMTIPGFKKCPHHDHYQYAESNAECPLCVADRNNPPQREMTLGEILPLLQGKTIKIATMELGDIVLVFTDESSICIPIAGIPSYEGQDNV
jgi:hypothetical protein